ncbi:MAG TPA: polysaccharide pyruvyl transferase family protein [Pseudoalteromonas sp.]|nr:polysaccharide pyruvyl transferase family protein [Pseudoalteromonas sp.]|tara:strand:+ start:6207 stop:7358 length:1152 start_codon:yes stop_codon:yes gene_type:complete
MKYIMKKIGIITILNVNNYGAELQAFSLQYKLRKMGYQAEIINYLYYKNPDFVKEKKSLPLIKTTLKNKIKDFILKWLDIYSSSKHPVIAKLRKKRFNDFHKLNTKLSKTYTSYSQLYDEVHEYDVYMVGSDQVWNPNNGTNLAPFFLTFAPKNSVKVSFASSFGVESISKQYYSQYKEWLNNIDFLATREQDGVNIIKEVTGRQAEHVCDPTMLLTKEQWQGLMKPYNSNSPYILLFMFKNLNYAVDLAYELQKKTGYKIIRVCKNEMPVENDDKILNIRDFGPAEFLGIYSSASIIITTSFHGTVFSLLFEKPFYTITPQSKNNNSRQQGILKFFGLEGRLLKEDQTLPDLTDISIPYDRVTPLVNDHRQKSLNFLKGALE